MSKGLSGFFYIKKKTNELKLSNGALKTSSEAYYIPQIFGQFNHLAIAEALRVDEKFKAFKEILKGNVTEENLNIF